MLAGGWTDATKFEATDHRSRRWSEASFAKRLGQVDAVRFLVKDGIPDMASAALRYALATPLVSCALVGARTAEQIQHAVKAVPDEGAYFPQSDLERLATMEL
jgi:aryl-alcohol dehydrogenase-like predicted oxidoreductase